MKTAEEIYKQNGCDSKRDIIDAMKEYAIEVAKEALKNAGDYIIGLDLGYQSDDSIRDIIMYDDHLPKL